jgi:hypothetical protein
MTDVRELQPKRPLVRLTVNLLAKSADALDETAETEGNPKTDTVNRALQVYAFLVREQAAGKVFAMIDGDGVVTRIRWM